MNNGASVPVDGPETPGSSGSAEMTKPLRKPGVMSSRRFLPVMSGASMGIVMAVMVPRFWYLWMPAGWGVGLAISTSSTSSGASRPSEAAENE